MPTRKPQQAWLKNIVVFACLFACFILVERQVNTYLGQRAIAENGLAQISFTEALQRAQREQKPIVANFSALWCAACRRLENGLLKQTSVHDSLNNDVIYVRLEETDDAHSALFSQYKIRQLPTLILLDPQGKPIRTLDHQLSAEQFIEQFN